MDVNTSYRGWLAALARSNPDVAREHALALLVALRHGERPPGWSPAARESFEAWCAGEGLSLVPVERRARPRE